MPPLHTPFLAFPCPLSLGLCRWMGMVVMVFPACPYAHHLPHLFLPTPGGGHCGGPFPAHHFPLLFPHPLPDPLPSPFTWFPTYSLPHPMPTYSETCPTFFPFPTLVLPQLAFPISSVAVLQEMDSHSGTLFPPRPCPCCYIPTFCVWGGICWLLGGCLQEVLPPPHPGGLLLPPPLLLRLLHLWPNLFTDLRLVDLPCCYTGWE